MKKIVNISRSIITILFICCIVIFIAVAFVHGESSIFVDNTNIIYYLVAILSMLGIIYMNHLYSSKKYLNKMGNLKSVYKYVYIGVVTIFTRIFMAHMYYKSGNIMATGALKSNGVLSYIVQALEKLFSNMSQPALCAYCVLSIVVAFFTAAIIKKILYRVCENETLAYIASVLYLYIPANLYFVGQYNRYLFNMLFVMLGIYCIIKIYYEIVQYKVKNNKYLVYTTVLTLTVILDILFGGNIWFWLCLLIIFILTNTDVDTVNIRYKTSAMPRKDYISKDINETKPNKKSQNPFVSGDFILIPKTLIVFVALAVIGITVQIIYNASDYGVAGPEFYSIVDVFQQFVKHTGPYYIGCGCIIIICQILCILLRRKVDYKIFLLMIAIVFYAVFSMGWQNIYGSEIVFATLLEVLLVMLIGNIYYNRDEKIKLLTR